MHPLPALLDSGFRRSDGEKPFPNFHRAYGCTLGPLAPTAIIHPNPSDARPLLLELWRGIFRHLNSYRNPNRFPIASLA